MLVYSFQEYYSIIERNQFPVNDGNACPALTVKNKAKNDLIPVRTSHLKRMSIQSAPSLYARVKLYKDC